MCQWPFLCLRLHEKPVQGPCELGVTPRGGWRGCPHGAWCGQWTRHLGVWLSHKPAPRRSASPPRTSVFHLQCGDDPILSPTWAESRWVELGSWSCRLESFSLSFSHLFSHSIPGPTSSPICFPLYSHTCLYPLCPWRTFTGLPVYTIGGPDASAIISANSTTGNLTSAHLYRQRKAGGKGCAHFSSIILWLTLEVELCC